MVVTTGAAKTSYLPVIVIQTVQGLPKYSIGLLQDQASLWRSVPPSINDVDLGPSRVAFRRDVAGGVFSQLHCP